MRLGIRSLGFGGRFPSIEAQTPYGTLQDKTADSRWNASGHKPSSEAPHLGMFAKEAGPGRAALHAPVDWLHQVWPAVLLAWPRAMLQREESASGYGERSQSARRFKETTNKLLQHLLFQMSPLPPAAMWSSRGSSEPSGPSSLTRSEAPRASPAVGALPFLPHQDSVLRLRRTDRSQSLLATRAHATTPTAFLHPQPEGNAR
ncbi:hypothetical protein EYF80_033383 [Liparis tanakae]|uniref:Uncharacterized protein n=1 Tax=Liparis tanakae TaxID=230148 RepID=A0A4Z2GUM6_9TELE|nr:hypothetical protein EYF80_033383 [Liparis tanakae]